MTNLTRTSIRLALALLGAAMTVVAAAQDWSNYDWSQEEIVLGEGRTTDQSLDFARQAVANSRMKLSLSAVGFDISQGSKAETYLQQVAQVAGGTYYRAEAGGQLAQVMDLAATGQPAGPQVPAGAVQVLQPKEGDIAGPSIEVVGRGTPGEVVVIYCVVFGVDQGDKLRTVPGIRHRIAADGTFNLRIATPRVSFGAADAVGRLRYEVHVHTVDASGAKGPATVINLLSPVP